MTMEELIGRTLGQYEIKEKIGEGGMAHVFKAYQPSLNRFVAVKVLSLSVAEKKGFTERFQREAHSVAGLNHPNILPVYDFGVQDGYSYIVMRYVEHSTTLGHLIERGTPLDQLINYITQVADALNYAHEQGVIHRDVKPGNILIDGKWALLSDFGLVKINEAAAPNHLTSTGHSMGTPAYMSPEQVDGISVDHRTDIYALGIILYKILTGAIPHDAPTPIGILVKRKSEPVPPLRQINPNISEGLEQVTLRALAMNPDKRYSSATNFAEALKKAQADPHYRENFNGASDTKEEMTMVGRGRMPKVDDNTLPYGNSGNLRQNRGWVAGGVVVTLLMGGIIIFLLLFRMESDDSSAVKAEPQIETPANTAVPTALSTPTPPGTPQAIAQTKLEVYSGPGDFYELMGYLQNGNTAEITGQDETNQWWQIKTSLSNTGLGWIKMGPSFSKVINIQNVPIALAPPTPTSMATPASETRLPTPTFTPDVPTVTPTPSPSPTATDGLTTFTLWGSSVSGSLGGGGKEQWFKFNSGKEKDATLIVFIRNAERIQIFLYHGRDVPRWPPPDPNAVPNLGSAAEEAINRDNDDRTREFTWQGPVTPNTQYFVRMINWGQAEVFYCVLTRPDKGSCP